MPVIVDPAATFTALRSGEIDATTRPLSPELISQFSGSNQVGLVKTASLQFPELRLNFEHTPFDQPDFRRALSRALDRDQLLETVFLGQGRAADKGYPYPDAPFANRSLSTPYAPDESRALLDGLGYLDRDRDGVREGPNGPLRYQALITGSLPTDVRAGELVAEDLGKVGIEGHQHGRCRDRGAVHQPQVRPGDQHDHRTRRRRPRPVHHVASLRLSLVSPDAALPAVGRAVRPLEGGYYQHLQDMQALFNQQPTSIPLYYPDEYWAYRPSAFRGWLESPGFGIVHKWSLLPPEAARKANAVVESR